VDAAHAPLELVAPTAGGDARLVARHQAVSDALARIEANEYGICTNCNELIPYGRLLAMPETTRCIGCGRAA
jgi:RNA polymerase-binding transcription factor DksA